jgi:L-amino acid N-acyltransferase YncA
MQAACGENLIVRDSALQDIRVVEGIYGHHVRNGLASFEEAAPLFAELARRRAEVLDAGLPYLVAELGGRVVGYAYASPYRERTAYRFTVEDSVYVEPALVGRRIGRELLASLISRCAGGRWRQMVAVIGDSANIASIRLHERAGFRLVGTLQSVGFKLGRWVDTVVMQRDLGDGDSAPPPAQT